MALIDAVFADRPGMTPQDVERQRRLAQKLLEESSGTEPLQHPLQAVAKMLTAGVGAYREGKARKGEQAGLDYRRQEWAKAIGGGAAPTPTTGAAPGPLPATAAGAQIGATAPATDVSQNGDTFSPFIDAVKTGGLTNPYGLAAVAATGRAESGWSPQNAARSWSDPSESGQAGSAGGVMSWRAERLANLRQYAASKGEQGNGSPQTQGEFFMREDPGLIAKLNAAKTPEEAQSLMNNAWKFAGYNRPGGEAARRLGYANAYLPQFQGNVETASLDPSVGIPSATAAIETQAPTPYRDPMVVQSPQATALASQEMQASTAPNRQPLAPQLPPPVNVSTPVVTPENAQLAQVLTGGQSAQPTPGISPQVIQHLLGNPWTADIGEKLAGAYMENQSRMALQQQQAANEERQWYARKEWERQAQQNDPGNQLDLRYKQAQLDALTGKKQKNWQKLSDTMLFDPESGETKSIDGGVPTGGFRFSGNSVEAQSLNGLIDSGQLTPEQAQQLGAGKTVSGPNGELLFLTPQGVFSQQGNQSPQPVSGNASAGEIDIFAGAPTAAQPAAPPQQGGQSQSGIIPLTEPKVTIDERKAAGFADRMAEAEKALGEFGSAGSNVFDNFVRGNDWIPDAVENWMVSKDFQQYDQARRNFVNAVLRRESGAVISPEEFENANKQYFPQPGDTADVIEQKRQNRHTVMDAMKRDAGPTYGSGVNGDWKDVDGVKIRRK
ncbi:MAG: hypothetical protein J0I23_17715 [Rhizobiales bacterium]|nr:hypothetical protein [Hyphomicrobiales bacterium]